MNFNKHRRHLHNFWIPIFILVGYWFISGQIFFASRLECYSQFGLCPDSISQEISWLINTPLLKPLPNKQIRDQLSKYSQIKEIRLYRRLPSTIICSLILRKPIGLITPNITSIGYLLDNEGVVLGVSNQQNLPVLLDSGLTLPLPQKVDSRYPEALNVLQQLSTIIPGTTLGILNKNKLQITVSDGPEVIFDLQHLPEKWPATLQSLFNRSKIITKMPKTIDLRFSTPVVIF